MENPRTPRRSLQIAAVIMIILILFWYFML